MSADFITWTMTQPDDTLRARRDAIERALPDAGETDAALYWELLRQETIVRAELAQREYARQPGNAQVD